MRAQFVFFILLLSFEATCKVEAASEAKALEQQRVLEGDMPPAHADGLHNLLNAPQASNFETAEVPSSSISSLNSDSESEHLFEGGASSAPLFEGQIGDDSSADSFADVEKLNARLVKKLMMKKLEDEQRSSTHSLSSENHDVNFRSSGAANNPRSTAARLNIRAMDEPRTLCTFAQCVENFRTWLRGPGEPVSQYAVLEGTVRDTLEQLVREHGTLDVGQMGELSLQDDQLQSSIRNTDSVSNVWKKERGRRDEYVGTVHVDRGRVVSVSRLQE